jgi:hypothetical protein
MVLPLVAGAAGKAAESANRALSNDIALIRYHRPASVKGKGRSQRPISERDVELHINPVSVGVGTAALGVAALGAGVGLYAMGLGVGKQSGNEITRRAINYYTKIDGKWVFQRCIIYNARGMPIGTLSSRLTTYTQMLKTREVPMSYSVTNQEYRVEETDTDRREIYIYRLKTDATSHFTVYSRPRGGLFGDSTVANSWLDAVSPISWLF